MKQYNKYDFMSTNTKSVEIFRVESKDSASYIEESISNNAEAKTIEIDPFNPNKIRFFESRKSIICPVRRNIYCL